MATTYAPPTANDANRLNEARFELGDKGQLTDADGNKVWLLQDEEILFQIGKWGYAEGVAKCADGLAIDKAQEPTSYSDEGGVTVSWAARIKGWEALAARLRAGMSKTQVAVVGGPTCGPLSGPSTKDLRIPSL